MILLYESTETDFSTNGIGALSPTVCHVTEELNGEFELYMEIPISADHYSAIGMRSLILAKPNPYSDPQPFRVYRMTKPLGGIVSVYARHIAYDLSGIVVEPYTASDIGTAINGFSSHALTQSPFTFSTVRTTAANFKVEVPTAVWSLMGGQAGSILDVYGGEYDFDKFTVYVLNRRGDDRGVSVRYGKNMVNLEQDTSCASCYTGVIAYWTPQEGEDGSTVTGNLINAQGTFDYTRIKTLDCTEKFETAPTVAQLDAAATSYINAHNIGVPDVSWKVEFAPLAKTAEYANIEDLERVYLGDTISVLFVKLGVNASARVVKTEYDVLLDRYTSVHLGRVKSSLADTIVEQGKAISERPTRTIAERIASALSDSLLNALGGSIRLLDTNGDGEADELYIADNPDPLLAQKVWRFNYLGWAASSTGYNGTFTMGATLENGLLANFITAANLRAGTIQSADGDSVYINLDTGVIVVKDSNDNIMLQIDPPNGKFILNTPDLVIDGYGNATFSGNLNAAGGTFSGNLSAAGGTFSGDLLAAGGTFTGALSAATGSFSGSVTATSGLIGSWYLDNNGNLYTNNGQGVTLNARDGKITVGNYTIEGRLQNNINTSIVGNVSAGVYAIINTAGSSQYDSWDIYGDTMRIFPTVQLNTALPILSGGTGAKNAASARANLGIIEPTLLYDGDANGSLTLVKSAANYDYLDIFFEDENGNCNSVRLYDPNYKTVSLSVNVISSTHLLHIKTSIIYISNKSITVSDYNEIDNIGGSTTKPYWSGSSPSIANKIHIKQVVGWV